MRTIVLTPKDVTDLELLVAIMRMKAADNADTATVRVFNFLQRLEKRAKRSDEAGE